MKNRHLANTISSRPSRKGPEYSADKLMRAALELFSRHDFSTVTIKEIAAASSVNAALIYYYYDSKEDLFRAAIEFAIKKALDRYSVLRDKNTEPRHLINEWFRSNLEMATLVRQLVKIMLDYAGSTKNIPSVERLINQFYTMEVEQILAASIERGIARGQFRNCEARKIARVVSVHLDGIMVASIIRPNFKIKSALSDLQEVLWSYLGHAD
jgi:AcrR family transcriptional regulator